MKLNKKYLKVRRALRGAIHRIIKDYKVDTAKYINQRAKHTNERIDELVYNRLETLEERLDRLEH